VCDCELSTTCYRSSSLSVQSFSLYDFLVTYLLTFVIVVFAEFDCPVFEDLYDCIRQVAGGSLAAADCVCSDTADIAINWCGGWHHAKRYIVVVIISSTATATFNLPGSMILDSISVRKRYDVPRALRCHWSGDATPAVSVGCVYLTAAV